MLKLVVPSIGSTTNTSSARLCSRPSRPASSPMIGTPGNRPESSSITPSRCVATSNSVTRSFALFSATLGLAPYPPSAMAAPRPAISRQSAASLATSTTDKPAHRWHQSRPRRPGKGRLEGKHVRKRSASSSSAAKSSPLPSSRAPRCPARPREEEASASLRLSHGRRSARSARRAASLSSSRSLARAQPDLCEEVTGPAFEGRVQGRRADARRGGVRREARRRRDALRRVETPKGEYLVGTRKEKGPGRRSCSRRRAHDDP
jgi:hypothetical protein